MNQLSTANRADLAVNFRDRLPNAFGRKAFRRSIRHGKRGALERVGRVARLIRERRVVAGFSSGSYFPGRV